MTPALIFTDYNNSLRVTYKVNILNASDDNFTVSEVIGLRDLDVQLGLSFRQLVYTVAVFKAFAASHGMRLTFDDGKSLVTILQDFTGTYYYGGLGVDLL